MQYFRNVFQCVLIEWVITILNWLSLFWIFLSEKNLDLYSKCEIYSYYFTIVKYILSIITWMRGKERERKEERKTQLVWLISFKDAHCEKQHLQNWGHVPSVDCFLRYICANFKERAAISVWFSKITLQCFGNL